MKTKNVVTGIVQIILSLGIFGSSYMLYHQKRHINSRTEELLSVQIRQAALHEDATKTLHAALSPLKSSVDAIVNLRDYQVMNKKPLYDLGNAFTGMQKSIHTLQAGLRENEKKYHKIATISITAEKENDANALFYYLLTIVCIGIGFLTNGIYLCSKE